MNKVYMTWSDVEQACDQIAVKFREKVDLIVGITRGGLTPAVMLSHRMQLPMMTCNITTRDGNDVDIDQYIIELSQTSNRILVVDDINDSGLTIEIVKSHLLNCSIATLTHKPNTSVYPDQKDVYSVFESPQSSWVVFPWEV